MPRFEAQLLVARLRPRIRAAAGELIRCGCLTGDEVASISKRLIRKNRPEQAVTSPVVFCWYLAGSYTFVSRVVLVVDDEPLILVMTASMLEDLGCEVVTAGNAPKALAGCPLIRVSKSS